MFTNRFLLVISILSLLLVSLIVASPLTHDTETVDISWPPRPVIRPVTAVSNLDAYYQSERTLVDPNAGIEIYQLSERTLMDPQAGLAIYQQSERTSVPVRFNKYQLSEWFGK